jgi:hypothetical protein
MGTESAFLGANKSKHNVTGVVVDRLRTSDNKSYRKLLL